ncbi:MAG: DUF1330 domain-containing protein [Acidimicrobiia bacterium]|nr:DUF1330 domain-containing protein [Acidimicrobiia bacterium]
MHDSPDTTARRYIDPTEQQGRALFTRGIQGPISMLNLLRFRHIADYSAHPSLAPDTQVSGKHAYAIYSRHTLPYLEALGGSVVLAGEAQPFLIGPADETWDLAMVVRHRSLEAFLIGPADETWDLAMVVRHRSLEAFLSMATDPGYLAGIGHRQAALEDSRLLPIIEAPDSALFS